MSAQLEWQIQSAYYQRIIANQCLKLRYAILDTNHKKNRVKPVIFNVSHIYLSTIRSFLGNTGKLFEPERILAGLLKDSPVRPGDHPGPAKTMINTGF